MKQSCGTLYVRGLPRAHPSGQLRALPVSLRHLPPRGSGNRNTSELNERLEYPEVGTDSPSRVSGILSAIATAAVTFFPPVRTTEGNYRI